MNNKHYLLALNRMPLVGPRTVSKLVQRWPELGELFALSMAELEAAGLPYKLAYAIKTFDFTQVDKDWQWQDAASNHHVLTLDDIAYPRLLKEIYDPPPVLYAIGDLSVLHAPTVAIVGTRKPTIPGQETARRFAFELAAHGVAIVSGLALGIDGEAHAGCLDADGQTIAVLGTGVDCIYPRRHQELARKITQQGLLLSEFPLGTPPVAGHFPRRNRIISGLSLATLVVEAAIKSGSLITARLALDQNRDVLAIPGSIYNSQTQGCHYLLQQGAKLVTSSEDVLNELRLDSAGLDESKPVLLATGDEKLVKCIGFETTSVDLIAMRSGLSIEDVACGLAGLELQGIVKAVPGGYIRCVL
ncbi:MULTISPECIES: DNA-processing protein DprA [Legionella]|uniref:DNA-processing protein DprA n=1 Tax=Legionella TaxID=445 RepID=UPI000F8EF0CF|nr:MULTISPECIES: DNA-processing protein DprA [Legionella]MCP0913985.1 DNA-processing protein DprA [Legionella sp. 27cVA30]RUR10706.1 DNA-protecting protein DprA [Legionella septentrionalis]